VTLAPLADHCPLWAWSLTGAAAADETIPDLLAIDITLTHHAGVELGVGAKTVLAATTPAARIENGAVSVDRARFRTAFAPAAFVARQTVDDRLHTDPVNAGVRDTRVILLAATVAVIRARLHARPAMTDFAFATLTAADVLSQDSTRTRGKQRANRNANGAQKPAPVLKLGQRAGQCIEPRVIHAPPPASLDRRLRRWQQLRVAVGSETLALSPPFRSL
jgi:hypothetical protein